MPHDLIQYFGVKDFYNWGVTGGGVREEALGHDRDGFRAVGRSHLQGYAHIPHRYHLKLIHLY